MRPSEDYARACGLAGEIAIAGRTFRIGKLSPKDVGDLQAWFKTIIDDPRKGARDRLLADPGMDDETARQIWVDAATEALSYPPELGSELASILLDTEEGQARYLWICLRRHQPEITLDDARELTTEITAEELTRLMACALPGELGDVIPHGDGGSPPTYREIRAKLCEHYGWSYEAVDNMPFELIYDAINSGKVHTGISVTSGAQAREVVTNWRSYVRGL